MRDAEVIVMGGGPAGACAAGLVAAAGRDVLLLERSPGPRFKVGESLMPATYWTLQRLGVLEALEGSAFPEKRSVQFVSADGRASTPFYFEDHDAHESSRTWQVLRSEFDRLLLDNARRLGAKVVRGASVEQVLFDGDRAVGVRARRGRGEPRDLRCRVVVDATGQRALLARRLRLLERRPGLDNASVYSHFRGARRDTGIDEGATLVYHTENEDSWFWFIPLPGERASVGVVGSIDYLLRGRRGGPQRILDSELALCPALGERLAGARQIFAARTAQDFTYRSRRLAGDGWILVGDAFGFIDPIYSSGVFLALRSGELAADAIVEGLAEGDLTGERLGRFAAAYEAGMEAILSLVYAFYDRRFSFANFLGRHPRLRGPLTDVLIGNVYRRPVDGLLEALEREVGGPPPSLGSERS